MHPAVAAVMAAALYFAALLPLLSHHNFDTSVLIVAGRNFVDTQRVPSPITVRTQDGYDGQFYYRLALDPFSLAQDAYGVRIDSVPWRAQRILYPLITYAASLGRPEWVPPALMLVNLAGLAAIAFFATRLAHRLELGWSLPAAILLWPGLIITLGRDLTEIVSAAFLLAAIDSYLARRMAWFAILGAAATLARETNVLFLFGVFAFEAFRACRRSTPVTDALWCALAMAPHLLWRVIVTLATNQTTTRDQLANIDWPMFGFAKAFAALKHTSFDSVFAAAGLSLMLAWIALVAFSIGRRVDGVVTGWLVLAAAMLCLASGGGPLVEPIAFFRAFTECYVVGALILARSRLWQPVLIIPTLAIFWYGARQAMIATNW